MMLRCYLLFLSSLYFTGLSAQQQPNTLLWRISGKDGHHLSYLYGTMHLTDDRVFNLGDSLYAAIAHSDGFAMELDPESLTSLLIDEVKKQINNQQKIKDMLPEGEYRTYGPRLARRLGKPADEITSEDILREKNKWITEAFGQGKMPTFLDTYLFDIARRQNKWTGGVEDAADQKGLLDDVVDENDIRFLFAEDADSSGRSPAAPGLSSMIDAYAAQDLSAIDSMDHFMANRDVILVKRNKKMAARMDSLAGVRSMVFAVGAAHLPGAEGLISLLRQKGFTVEPVFSSRKIRAADFVVPELPRTWQDVQDESGYYRESMPGKPADIELYGVVNMKMYFDLFDGIGYFSTAGQTVNTDRSGDSLMDALAKSAFKGSGKQDYTPVVVDGARGRIYEMTDLFGYKKGLVLVKADMVYFAYAVSWHASVRNKKNAEQFVRSFHILDRNRSAPAPSLTRVPFVDSVAGYRLATAYPAKAYEPPGGSNGWNSKTYASADRQSGIYYFFASYSARSGTYIPNDSDFYYNMEKETVKNSGDLISDSSWLENGRRILEFRATMKKADDYEIITRYISRGNRWYTLMVTCPRKLDHASDIDSFFTSFRLLDWTSTRWQPVVAGDSLFRTWGPAPVVIEPPTEAADADDSKNVRYVCFDSSRTMSYVVDKLQYSPYFWSNSDSAFWADRISGDLSEGDSVVSKRPVRNGPVDGWEWLKTRPGSHLFNRRRVLRYGRDVVYIFASGLRGELESANTDRFFDEFRLLSPPLPGNLLEPKAARLLQDLSSEDSATSHAAEVYLNIAPFVAADLPLLHQALMRSPNRQSYWTGETLVRRISDLHDSSSFRFAANAYRSVPDTSVTVKNRLLELMGAWKDSLHFATLAQLLRAAPPAGELSYPVISALTDSLQLSAGELPVLLPLLADSLVRPSLIAAIGPIADSGLLKNELIAPYRAMILSYAAARVRLLSDSAAGLSADGNLIQLLGAFNDERANALLQSFLGAKEKSLRLSAMTELLRHHQQPAARGIRSLAASRVYRLEVYRTLKKYRRLSLMPPAYRTPEAIAAAVLVGSLRDDDDGDDDDADSIVLVTNFLRDIGQGKQRFFVYRLTTGESTYLAAAGPFDPAIPTSPGKAASPGWYKDDAQGRVMDEEYDPGQRRQQIDALIQKFKD